MSKRMKMRVFISYSSKDAKEYAKRLFDLLFRRGHDPYLFDHGCISEIIWDKIYEEIGKRELCIFIVTNSSSKSKGQKQEYDFAVVKYKTRMSFSTEKASEMKIMEKTFPGLCPYRHLIFNDNNLAEKCEIISTDLVKLKDKENLVIEEKVDKKERGYPKLTVDGLDKKEIEKCIDNLFDSYQKETIIPEAFITNEASKSEKLNNIGINFRLPRDWFLSYEITKQIYSNEHMFGQFGRNIALGERKYLNDKIMENKNVFHVNGIVHHTKDLFNKINEAISVINSNGFKPAIIFPTINHLMKIYNLSRIKGKANLKYGNIIPRPLLDPSVIIEGTELRLINPLGKIPTNTIIMGEKSVRWLLKKYPKHGSLYLDIGNDRFYPKKYVQVIAITTTKCEIDPKGIVVIKSEN